jgi:hypothetical protein
MATESHKDTKMKLAFTMMAEVLVYAFALFVIVTVSLESI